MPNVTLNPTASWALEQFILATEIIYFKQFYTNQVCIFQERTSNNDHNTGINLL